MTEITDEGKIRLTLPAPPSTNRLWRHAGKRVYLDASYTAWKRTAGWEAMASRPGRFPRGATVAVSIKVGKPKRPRDIDNMVKPLLDLMQSLGIITNDKDVSNLIIAWDAKVEAGRVQIEAKAVSDDRPEWFKRGYVGGPA